MTRSLLKTEEDFGCVDEFSLKKSRPSALLPTDIQRLMRDLGRQELHTLVSDCVEQCAHWRQLMMHLQGKIDHFLDESKHEDDAEEGGRTEQKTEFLLEVRTLYRLWKHRLEMLELIAQAQYLHEFERQQRQLRSVRKARS